MYVLLHLHVRAQHRFVAQNFAEIHPIQGLRVTERPPAALDRDAIKTAFGDPTAQLSQPQVRLFEAKPQAHNQMAANQENRF